MRVADYIVARLEYLGVKAAFLVAGGGAMHLNDAIGATTQLRKQTFHHEQAAAIAAEGYARTTGRPALVNVTTGPGALNALNGVFGAYTDSIPMIVISGQVKRETLIACRKLHGLRQLGDQEVDIVSMVTGITKWAHLVTDVSEVPQVVDHAFRIACCGRPGPVWIDVPVDVQGAEIDALADGPISTGCQDRPPAVSPSTLHAVIELLLGARRPVVFAGSGVRIAGALKSFECLIARLGIPVVTAWTHDLIESDHPLFAGRPGTIGTRAGNFVVQSSDCVLVLGSRLNIRQVSYNWKSFARRARKIWVDIDAAEFRKPYVQADLAVHADLALFIPALEQALVERGWKPPRNGWPEWCRDIRQRYSPKEADYPVRPNCINPYHFAIELFSHLNGDDTVVCGDATACIVPFQCGAIKKGMRLFSNSGCASMGYDLPAAIGAAIGVPERRVICLAGDGSVMMNIQELQTLASMQPNLKVFVLDNGGYLSIKQTQRNFFGREFASSPESGVAFPDYTAVARAFGVSSARLAAGSWKRELPALLDKPGPHVIQVHLDPLQEFEPRIKSRMVGGVIQTPELEDMFPFLTEEELESVMASAAGIQ